MARFNRLWMAGAVGVCTCLIGARAMAPAQLGAVNYTSFEPQGVNGMLENPTVDGMCKLRYESGQNRTGVHLTITGLLPGTTYWVNVQCTGTGTGANFLPFPFTTNPHGDGSFHGEFLGQADASATVQVYHWDGVTDIQDVVPPDMQRADAIVEVD